jgi:transposase-like protein
VSYQARHKERRPGMSGRKRKLTPEQSAELLRRWQLGRANTVSKIAADHGISDATLRAYINDALQ